jgi:hypothetical protein
MIFSKKAKPIEEITVEKCVSCGKMEKRKFKAGDVVFSELSECSSCKNKMRIEMIFGQTIE